MNILDCVKIIEKYGGAKSKVGKDCLSWAVEDYVKSRGYCAIPLTVLISWAKQLLKHEKEVQSPSNCPLCGKERYFTWGMLKKEGTAKYENMGKMVLLIKCDNCGLTDTAAKDYAWSN